jgi:hypothetical protein
LVKVKDVRPETVVAHPELELVDAKVALIQALIPVALAAVGELLTTEVTRLVGRKHSRTEGTPGYVRWGRPPGSIYLADQKVPLTYPRVQDRLRNHEVSLAPSQQLQTPRAADAGLLEFFPSILNRGPRLRDPGRQGDRKNRQPRSPVHSGRLEWQRVSPWRDSRASHFPVWRRSLVTP